jgi:cytochrome c-type biogenesis protein CcmH
VGLILPVLVAAAFALALIVIARPAPGWPQLAGAILLAALAGYAWQGRPGLPGKPVRTAVAKPGGETVFAAERPVWFDRFGSDALVLDAADAFIRNGDPSYAAGVLRGELSRNPDRAVLWLGYGNALAAAADGVLTPAARYAYARAVELAPSHPGPAYFLAIAEAQAGDLDAAKSIWDRLASRADMPDRWRALIGQKLQIVARLRHQP